MNKKELMLKGTQYSGTDGVEVTIRMNPSFPPYEVMWTIGVGREDYVKAKSLYEGSESIQDLEGEERKQMESVIEEALTFIPDPKIDAMMLILEDVETDRKKYSDDFALDFINKIRYLLAGL